jgi:hypothetical protein
LDNDAGDLESLGYHEGEQGDFVGFHYSDVGKTLVGAEFFGEFDDCVFDCFGFDNAS